MIVLAAAVLLCLGASFRAGVAWLPPKSNMTDPRPWYDKTACFYIFYFGVEILTVALYLIGRIDPEVPCSQWSERAGQLLGPAAGKKSR